MLALSVSFLAMAAPHGRKLSYEQILNYSPGSKVTDHANIDLDQKMLESYLGSNDFTNAKAVYTSGAHSKPTATCALTSPTTVGQSLSKGDAVTFTTTNGDAVSGKSYSSYAATDTSVSFTYPVSSLRVEPAASACYEGGLKPADYSSLGCIAVAGGSSTFTILGTTYTGTCTNKGKRTLQGFSTKAKSVMNDCPVDSTVSYANGCPYTTYKPYYDYYGSHSYADDIVLAALDDTAISGFTNGGAIIDSPGAANVVRVQMAKKGTAYMNAWMYAIREFEDAIDDCTVGDLTANALSSGPVHAWDEGVAFYVGSILTFDDLLAGNLPTLDGKGKLAYTLGNKRCKNYQTCGPSGTALKGEAKANIDLFRLYQSGQYELLIGNCAGVVPYKNQIFEKSTVPLVQGTLRYAMKMAHLSGGPEEQAEGAIFAAAVLPQVHACDPAAATTIYDNMKMGVTTIDYMAVKAAFEGCYSAMGITCADVGGLINTATGGYYDVGGSKTDPCVDPSTSSSSDDLSDGALIGIIAAAALAVICSLCVIMLICKEKSGKPLFTNLAEGAKA